MHDLPPFIDWPAWLLSVEFPGDHEPNDIGHVIHWAVQALKDVEVQVTIPHLAVFFQSESYRSIILSTIQDQQVREWWHQVYPTLANHQQLMTAAHWRVDQWFMHAIIRQTQYIVKEIV